MRIDFRAADLPSSFLTALGQLRQHRQFRQYPVFWQVFLWGWGGLLLSDRKEDDRAGIAAQSGVDESEIDAALSVFDLLFPVERGWIGTMPTASYSFVKMVPWPFQDSARGIGFFAVK